MPDCSDLQAEMDRLAHELGEASQNRRGHQYKTTGARTATAAGLTIVIGCSLAPVTGGASCAGAAILAAGAGAVGSGYVYQGSLEHLNLAIARERALQGAYNNAKSTYCACVFGQETGPLPELELPPEPPEPDFDDLDELEEQLEQCMEDDDEDALCEMPDEADQYTPAPDEEDDADLAGSGASNDQFFMGGM
jgi:hypothetical protein